MKIREKNLFGNILIQVLIIVQLFIFLLNKSLCSVCVQIGLGYWITNRYTGRIHQDYFLYNHLIGEQYVRGETTIAQNTHLGTEFIIFYIMKLQIVQYHFLFTERNCQTSNAYYVYVVDTDALQHYKIIFFYFTRKRTGLYYGTKVRYFGIQVNLTVSVFTLGLTEGKPVYQAWEQLMTEAVSD